MTNKEKAKESIKLLREAVLGILEENPQGLRLGDIDDELGLQFDRLSPDNNRFMQKFMSSYLLPENPPQVRTGKIGSRRLYFRVNP